MIYMAAGNSRRFLSENKLLVAVRDRLMFEHGLKVFEEIRDTDKECRILVVTRFSEIIDYCERRNIDVIFNPSSKDGISFTIKAAIKHFKKLPGGVNADDLFLFMTADQPFIKAETVRHLIEASENEAGFECASVYYGDTPGSPTVFSAGLIGELMELEGDEGGRKVIRRHNELKVYVEDKTELFDIDERKDLI